MVCCEKRTEEGNGTIAIKRRSGIDVDIQSIICCASFLCRCHCRCRCWWWCHQCKGLQSLRLSYISTFHHVSIQLFLWELQSIEVSQSSVNVW